MSRASTCPLTIASMSMQRDQSPYVSPENRWVAPHTSGAAGTRSASLNCIAVATLSRPFICSVAIENLLLLRLISGHVACMTVSATLLDENEPAPDDFLLGRYVEGKPGVLRCFDAIDADAFH